MSRRVIFAGAIVLMLVFALLQFASDALFARAGTNISLPARLSCDQGIRIYAALPFLPPAYTAAPIVTCALQTGNLRLAETALAHLPPSQERSDLAGRVARVRGLRDEAARDFADAGDAPAVENRVDQLVRAGNILAAFRLEQALRNRMLLGMTHPNAVADSDWKLNVLATRLSRRLPSARWFWLGRALQYDREAVALSPYAERYCLAEGNRLLELGSVDLAERAFRQATQINPSSADALAGLGLAAIERGDLSSARKYEERAQLANPHSAMLLMVKQKLQRQPNSTFSPPRKP